MVDRGTAKVWGIRFEVTELVGRGAKSEFDGMAHTSPEKTDARVRFTLGDDVEVQLEKVPDIPITFTLNGQLYGALEVGDKVIIDKNRNVIVNDTVRQPEESGS